MKSTTLAFLFLSIFSLTISAPMFCMKSFYTSNKRLERSNSSPSIREHSNQEKSMKRLNSDLNKKFEKMKKEFYNQKTLMTGPRLKRKLSDLSIKIPDRGGPENKLIENLGMSYSPQKTPRDIIEENEQYISAIIGKKYIENYPENPSVGIFEGSKEEKPKKPKACKLVKLFVLDPETTAKYYSECLHRKEPEIFQ